MHEFILTKVKASDGEIWLSSKLGPERIKFSYFNFFHSRTDERKKKSMFHYETINFLPFYIFFTINFQ